MNSNENGANRPPKLHPLTSIRFFAAALIVLQHSAGSFGISREILLEIPTAQGVSVFFVLSGFIFALSRMAQIQENKVSAAHEAPDKTKKTKKPEREPEEFLEVDRVSVHVGVRLISMVDPRKNNTIFERIGTLRRKFVQDMGVVIPLVRLPIPITRRLR